MVGGGSGRVKSAREEERATGRVREGAWKGALRAIEWERIAEVRRKGRRRRKGNEKDEGTRRTREGGGRAWSRRVRRKGSSRVHRGYHCVYAQTSLSVRRNPPRVTHGRTGRD